MFLGRRGRRSVRSFISFREVFFGFMYVYVVLEDIIEGLVEDITVAFIVGDFLVLYEELGSFVFRFVI